MNLVSTDMLYRRLKNQGDSERDEWGEEEEGVPGREREEHDLQPGSCLLQQPRPDGRRKLQGAHEDGVKGNIFRLRGRRKNLEGNCSHEK